MSDDTVRSSLSLNILYYRVLTLSVDGKLLTVLRELSHIAASVLRREEPCVAVRSAHSKEKLHCTAGTDALLVREWRDNAVRAMVRQAVLQTAILLMKSPAWIAERGQDFLRLEKALPWGNFATFATRSVARHNGVMLADKNS